MKAQTRTGKDTEYGDPTWMEWRSGLIVSPLDRAEVIQVIRTTLTTRGNGIDDPVRRITQYWSMDGDLLAEVDPNDVLRREQS